ncbi:hypothetical protein ACU635_59090 [[Actinomadura] parvosata]|uniref:hypothetical protein n=1 Tax=[Actinomadura] parvosata TaxID=1955412 RepID=UPI00406D177D
MTASPPVPGAATAAGPEFRAALPALRAAQQALFGALSEPMNRADPYAETAWRLAKALSFLLHAADRDTARNSDSSRWMVVLATARVSSAFSLRRSASTGTEGAAQCFLVRHQASQEVTAARLRFQVAGARPPHSSASTVPISASVTSASGRSRPRRTVTRSMAEA